MSRSANLHRLQNIDSQIQKNNARIDQINIILIDTKKLDQAEDRVMTIEGKLSEIQKKLRLAENKVNDQQVKIAETDKALYGGVVRNPKELQDLQKETAALRRYLEVLEDRQLEAMIALEEAETNKQSAIKLFVELKDKTKEYHTKLSKELSILMDAISRLHIERMAVIQTIDKEDLARYETLLSNRRGLAVSKIIDNTCGACGSTLTPAMIQAAQSPNQIVQCHSCYRIIYPG